MSAFEEMSVNKTNVSFGDDAVVIRQYNGGITGGRALDYTDFTDDVIKAGHIVVRKKNEDGVYEFASNNFEVWIDGVKLIDNADDPFRRASHSNAQRALAKGLHPIKVVFTGGIFCGWPTYWDGGSVRFRPVGGKWANIGEDMLFRK